MSIQHLQNGVWEVGADMPVSRGVFGVGVIDNKIYCAGGGDSITANTFADLLIYDINTNSWTTGSTMPGSRVNNHCVVYGGNLYSFGGRSATAPTDSVFVYEPLTDAWSEATPMPVAKHAHAIILVGSKVYAMGGLLNLIGGEVNTMHIYDITADSWSDGPSMPQDCVNGVPLFRNGKIYLLGPGSTQVYDTANESWELKVSETLSTWNFQSGVLYGQYGVIVGYEVGSQGHGDMLIYDTDNDTWTKGVALNYPRRSSSVLVGNKIYAIGGFHRNQNKLEIFTINDDDNGNGENPGSGEKCCCCGEMELKIKLPISNNLEILKEVNDLVSKVKGCDNADCCNS